MSETKLEDGTVIKINLKDFTGDVHKQIEDQFLKLEERLTPKKELKGLTEVSTDRVLENYDWRAPIEEMLKDTRSTAKGLSGGDYELWNRHMKVDEVVIRNYDKDKKETTYSLRLNEKLTEAIGTIAQGTANCCIPEIWADKIERDHVYPGSVFLGAWFMNWYTDIEGKPGDTVHVCRVAPALCVDLSCDEPDTVAPVIACPAITLEHDVCAYAICKNDLECVQYGLVDALNEALGSCLEVCVDNYFFNVALSCNNGGTLTSATPMSGSLLLEAMGSMMAGNQIENLSTDQNLPACKGYHAPGSLGEPTTGHQLPIRRPLWGQRRSLRRTA